MEHRVIAVGVSLQAWQDRPANDCRAPEERPLLMVDAKEKTHEANSVLATRMKKTIKTTEFQKVLPMGSEMMCLGNNTFRDSQVSKAQPPLH